MKKVIALAALTIGAASMVLAADFKKIRLNDAFTSEGSCVGDFNHDGKSDVASGPFWWEGPGFEKKHEFMPSQTWDPAKTYSNAFLMFTADFNKDGWDDIFVVDFPTKGARWYENPKGGDGHWVEHPVYTDGIDAESPLLTELIKGAGPVLVTSSGEHVGFLAPDADLNKPWTFHPINPKKGYGKFTHGTGAGDVNGDGRMDVMVHDGWYEQPEKDPATAEWTFHPNDFGSGGAQMFAYDVDGDGKNDVITTLVAHHYGVAWFKQLPDGTFEKHLIVGGPGEPSDTGMVFSQAHGLAMADMDGDGVLDLVTGKRRYAHGDHGDIEPKAPAVTYWFKIQRGEDGVHFIPHLLDDNTGVGTQVVAADANNDGKTDVLVGNKLGTTLFLQQDPPAVPADHAARKVLVFSMTKGFHHSSIPLGQQILRKMGQQSKEFMAVVDAHDDLSYFDPDKIKDFSAIVFANTTGEIPFTDVQKQALTDYVANGGAFVGIHSATDTLYKWAGYGDIIGGHFDGHPWGADVTENLRLEEVNPITKMFPRDFYISEEIYQMKEPYDRTKCDVLISLNTAKTQMGKPGIHRTDGDFPVSWIRNVGKGRVFYTSLGHNEAVWQREDFQEHILAGLKWAMKDFDLDAKSHPLPSTQPTQE